MKIARNRRVAAQFDIAADIERRVAFLAVTLHAAKAAAYVLGISGGVDSLPPVSSPKPR